MKILKVLIGFEESQAVCIEFRKLGHEAYSCDLQKSSGGHPEWHIQEDIFNVINGGAFTIAKDYSFQDEVIVYKWDLIILHPPCTYTALCGNRWYFDSHLRIEGVELCKNSFDAAKNACDHVVLEQPKTIMQRHIGQRSQSIHPWQYGHGETKETWLWLKGLPLLKPTNIVGGRINRIWKMGPSDDRSKLRSKTYPEIAKAMAEQYSEYLLNSIK